LISKFRLWFWPNFFHFSIRRRFGGLLLFTIFIRRIRVKFDIQENFSVSLKFLDKQLSEVRENANFSVKSAEIRPNFFHFSIRRWFGGLLLFTIFRRRIRVKFDIQENFSVSLRFLEKQLSEVRENSHSSVKIAEIRPNLFHFLIRRQLGGFMLFTIFHRRIRIKINIRGKFVITIRFLEKKYWKTCENDHSGFRLA